jgi:hypothetical protein
VAEANQDEAAVAERNEKQSGRYKKVCTTDPDASMATNARNRRLEPTYKQHAVVDDVRGVVLDVEVTTGEVNEGQIILERLDATAATTGQPSPPRRRTRATPTPRYTAAWSGAASTRSSPPRPSRSAAPCPCAGSGMTRATTS